MRPTVFNHKQYTDLEADYMILKAENEKLKAQLSTTNKRLEAAVECIEEVEYSLANSRFSAAWAEIRKWRWVQDEKGEAE